LATGVDSSRERTAVTTKGILVAIALVVLGATVAFVLMIPACDGCGTDSAFRAWTTNGPVVDLKDHNMLLRIAVGAGGLILTLVVLAFATAVGKREL
jgi:hypothetical protein